MRNPCPKDIYIHFRFSVSVLVVLVVASVWREIRPSWRDASASMISVLRRDIASPTTRAYRRISSAMDGSYLNATGKFSFVHVSKCAGSTFIRLLKTTPLNVCPKAETGAEHSAWYQHSVACKDSDYRLISLRSPRHHMFSLFTECKYDDWGKLMTKNTQFPNSGNEVECQECDERDFDQWLDSFFPMSPATERYYNCYHPANYQSRALTSHHVDPHGVDQHQYRPDTKLAMDTYRGFDYVALADFVHESRCMLYHQLGQDAPANAASYLEKSCTCQNQSNANVVHVSHHSLGHRSTLRDLPYKSLSKIESLTEVDRLVYTVALGEFLAKIAWLETEAALGRRVLCDNVLRKWEPELAYLNVSVTELYNVAKEIASNPRSDVGTSSVDWIFAELTAVTSEQNAEDPPPSLPAPGVCELIQTSAQCSTEGVFLGSFGFPNECAREIAHHPSCGDMFMFSTSYPAWGCRCCSIGGVQNKTGNANWALFSAAKCTGKGAAAP